MNQSIFNRTWFLLFALVAVTAFAYYPALSVGYYLDDYDSILNNPVVRDLNWSDLQAFFPGRELAYASFALNYKLFGLDPFYMHLTNLTLHLLVGVVFYFLVRAILLAQKDIDALSLKWIPLMAAMLMLLAPLNSQPVIYVVQRLVLLSTLFYTLAILFYIYFRTTNAASRYSFLVLAIGSFVLGLYSKQTVYTLPIAVIMLELFVFKSISSRRFIQLMILGFVGFLMLQITQFFGLVNYLDTFEQRTLLTNHLTRWEYITQQFTSVFMYIYKFFIPTPLRLEYGININDWSHWPTWAGLFLVTGSLLYAALSIKKRPLISFLIVFYFLMHLIESGVVVLADFAFEHRAYLPNIALSMLVAIIVFNLLRTHKKLIISVSVLWIGMSSFLVHERASLWAQPIEFYRHELAYLKNSARAYGGLAGKFAEQNDMVNAEKWYKASLVTGLRTERLDISSVVAYIFILNEMGDEGRSKAVAAQALKVFPQRSAKAKIIGAMASLDVRQGQCDFAEGWIKRAFSYDRRNLLVLSLKEECQI